jgi:transposase-like protein
MLSKDPDSFTMDDVEELIEIARLMEKEYMASGRRELLDYAVKLRIGALVIKVVLVEPKTRGLRSGHSAP